MSIPGAPNLSRVSDALYRSAQPTGVGLEALRAMGIRTVINLRSFHSDRSIIGDTRLDYEHIYLQGWYPEEQAVVRFLRIVTDPIRTPVLLHCRDGADRTGMLCAIYRIVVQGWSKDDAVREMKDGGFGFHGIWVNLVRYVHKLDVAAVRRNAGIEV